MTPFQLTRWIRLHSRVAVAWVLLPTVLMNGRTTIGCGCTGHFEAVCHCGCAHGCCGQKCVRSCCAGKAAENHLARDATSADRSEHAQPHRCTQIAQYVVIPTTTSPTAADAHDCQAAALTSVAADVAIVNHPILPGQTTFWDTRPPNDIVISFHRLVV